MMTITMTMMMMMMLMMMMMDTQYDGIKESNTGKDISPADPTVTKLVVVSLRIFYHHLSHPNHPNLSQSYEISQ